MRTSRAALAILTVTEQVLARYLRRPVTYAGVLVANRHLCNIEGAGIGSRHVDAALAHIWNRQVVIERLTSVIEQFSDSL